MSDAKVGNVIAVGGKDYYIQEVRENGVTLIPENNSSPKFNKADAISLSKKDFTEKYPTYSIGNNGTEYTIQPKSGTPAAYLTPKKSENYLKDNSGNIYELTKKTEGTNTYYVDSKGTKLPVAENKTTGKLEWTSNPAAAVSDAKFATTAYSGHFHLNGRDISEGSTIYNEQEKKEYYVRRISEDEITLIPESPGLPRFNFKDAETYTPSEYAEKFNDKKVEIAPVDTTKKDGKLGTSLEEYAKTDSKWTSRADDNKEEHESKLNNGFGSSDSGNVKGQDVATEDFAASFADKKVQDKFAELNGGEAVYRAGKTISHEHNQTMVDNYEYNGKKVTYLPGQAFQLADDPTKLMNVEPFKRLYEDTKSKNILSDNFKAPDGKWSRVEYGSVYEASGKYSMFDLLATMDAMDQSLFSTYEGPYYEGTPLKNWANDNKDKDLAKVSEELENDVNSLVDGWKIIHEKLDEMSGEAKNAMEFYTAQSIQGKYEIALANIRENMRPACLAINILLFNSDISSMPGAKKIKFPPPPENLPGVPKGTPLIKQLELGEKELNNYLGTGDEPKDPNMKDLKKKIDEAIFNMKNASASLHYLGKKPQHEKDDSGKIITDKTEDIKKWSERSTTFTNEYNKWSNELTKLRKQEEELTKVIEDYRKALNTIHEYAVALFSFIRNYDTYKNTYRKFVTPGNGGNIDIYDMIMNKDIEGLIKNHDEIINSFTDFSTMPQITAKVFYQPGDVVLYDDAHGLIYVVQGYDPLTGELIIACYDRNWKKVGSDIVVWDQREIAPVRGIRDIPGWNEYPDVPDTIPIDGTVPETTEDKPSKPTPTSNPKPTPNPTPGTIPKEYPGTPRTVPPTYPAPPKPVPPTDAPTPPPTPDIPVITLPPGGEDVIVYPEDPDKPYNPINPHTGLDAIYGTGETKQSAAGLGALAGLAAGAAGLGLTGLIGDKDDEEEEDEEEEFTQTIEEEKPTEENKEEKVEEQQEETSEAPKFF